MRILPVVAGLLAANALNAQHHTPTDRSLSTSLFAVSVPGPSAPLWTTPDSMKGGEGTRWEISYGRAARPTAFAGEASTLVIGVRAEQQSRERIQIEGLTDPDTSTRRPLTAGVAGFRVGLRADERLRSSPIGSIEGYVGGRTLAYTRNSNVPDFGFELVAGLSNFVEDLRGQLGFRFPLELVRETRHRRYTLFAVPTMAWGHIRMRGCEDMGPGDNCGDLGIQLAFGRTRFFAAGGASISVLPSRVSLSGGVQRMLAAGESARLWAGTSWTP
jgi:hypothetical protein